MRFRRKRKCNICGGTVVPEERFCERHLLKRNEWAYQYGNMSQWVDLELELWPPE